MKRRIALLIEEKATVYGGRVSNSLDVAQAIVDLYNSEAASQTNLRIDDLITAAAEAKKDAEELCEIVEMKNNVPWSKDSTFHLCNHCVVNDYPTCGDKVIMAGDCNEELTGADADRIIACSDFLLQHRGTVVENNAVGCGVEGEEELEDG